MVATKDDGMEPSKRDILIAEYLNKHGVSSTENAPDELLDAAHENADSILGAGNND